MSFSLDLEQFEKKTSKVANLVVRKIIFDVDASLVYKSPVGNPELWAVNATALRFNNEAIAAGSGDRLPIIAPAGYVGGRFRANWQYGVNVPNGKTTANIDPDGSASIERVASEVDQDALGKVHYLTNSLAYAKRLEDGWSKQAPSGMVTLTTIEFMPIVAAAAIAVRETGTKGFGL